ncbi:SRY-related protein AES1 [Rhipicephalus sanguineus]|uniref:Sex-determining region Y protein n=1 Tax=Rhipicephalus sanguineus TaxID=34632 RepID=A0A9D4TBT7_RHISA|nr:SRY-related protein AES1 [Rhipicephalus sanguineus]KAH7984486.1 hypothetical protein HPB52_021531 [Rhipicephalus sanguineus]
MGTDLSVAGLSTTSEAKRGYQLPSPIRRPPNASMLFPQEKRRSVAAENPNENNQRTGSRLGKLWRSLSADDDDELCQRKAAEVAADHEKRYSDYDYNPRDAHQPPSSRTTIPRTGAAVVLLRSIVEFQQ